MNKNMMNLLPTFLDTLGLEEEPMGLFYTDEEPDEGFTPKPNALPTREKEMNNQIDWEKVFGQFSCAMGLIWRARKKQGIAYFSAEQFGCPGGAFWLGFNKPQAETIINYVSTGIPNWSDGELSFTVSFAMFEDMLNRYNESFLSTKTWHTVQKKIKRSKRAWGELSETK